MNGNYDYSVYRSDEGRQHIPEVWKWISTSKTCSDGGACAVIFPAYYKYIAVLSELCAWKWHKVPVALFVFECIVFNTHFMFEIL